MCNTNFVSILVLLGFLHFVVGAPDLITNYQRIQGNPTNASLYIAGIGAGMMGCTDRIVTLSNDSVENILVNRMDGSLMYNWTFPAFQRSLHCPSEICFSLNPSAKTMQGFNSTSGATLRATGGTVLKNPMVVYGVQNSDIWYDAYVLDSTFNSSIHVLTVFANNNTARTRLIKTFTNEDQAAIGLFYINFTTIGVAFLGDTTIRLYSMDGNYTGDFLSVGSIGLVSRDFNGRTFVYDLSCMCIKVFDPAGTWIKTIDSSLLANPRAMAHSRNNIFVLDDTGILEFFEPLVVTTFNSSDTKCPSRGGSAFISVGGGAPPYLYHVTPDQIISTLYDTNFQTNVNVRNTGIVPYYIYADSIYPAFSDAYTNFSLGQRNVMATGDAIVAPYNGSYMYSMLMANGASYGFSSPNLIDSGFFQSIEFMINAGNGTQNFSISLDGAFTTRYVNGSLPADQWVKITIDMSNGTSRYYSTLRFTDLSGKNLNTSVIYVDDVVMIPYPPTTLHRLSVTDFCGAEVASPYFDIQFSDPLNLTIVSTPTSCALGGVDGSLAHDGILTAAVQGGVPPYFYSWSASLGNGTSSDATGLSTLRSNIVVFDNALNASFTDASFAADRNLNDSTMYHSPYYSISWAPMINAETLSFTYTAGSFDATKFSAFEFWVNGGATGQQLIQASVIRNSALLGNNTMIHNLLGIPSIPPNVWLKVSLPITPDMVLFTGIAFQSVGTWTQSRIFFDDIVLVSTELTVTVTDTAGCKAYSPFMEVVSPALMTVRSNITQLSCHSSGDGAVSLQVYGGSAPYFYQWSMGGVANSSNSTSQLSESEMSIVIYDSHGCRVPNLTIVDVLQPPPVGIKYEAAEMACFGGTGTITATAYGGIPPYTYSWTSLTNGSSSFTLTPKPAPVAAFADSFSEGFGFQSVGTLVLNQTIMCEGTGTFLQDTTLGSPSYSGYCSMMSYFNPLNRTLFSIGCSQCIDTTKYSSMEFHVLLENEADSPFMTVGLYTYGAATSEQMILFNYTDGMERGWKKVVVDFSSATQEIADTVNIRANQTVLGKILVDDVVLIPRSTLVTGSSSVVNAGFHSTLVGASGTYMLSVTDSKNCPIVQDFTITAPTRLNANGIIRQPSAHNKANGRITVNATGGTPPYTYVWRTSAENSSTLSGLAEGSYFVSVIDANGCMANSSFAITNPASSNTGVIAGIGVGVGLFVLGAALVTAFFVRRQRREAIQALIDVEEGERRAYKIDFSALELSSVIGAGSFGEVFSGEYKGTDVAVKKLRAQQMSKQQVDEFAREAAVMVGLRHPNILLFMGVCLEPSRLCIVTEFMPRGNLSDILRDDAIVLPIQILYRMALDTLKGLQFIHSSGIIHRDLKSPNLLVDKHWNIKIADFGLSCARHNANTEAQVSLLWTAPEILNREPDCYSFASDMYSFAIIMWELLSKKIPWEGTSPAAITSKVVGGQRPPTSPDWDAASTHLITMSWAQDPSVRPTVKQARAILENEIMPTQNDLELGSSASYSFTKKDNVALSAQVPPPHPPFAIVTATVEGCPKLWEEDPRATCKALEAMIKIFREFAVTLGGYEVSQDSPSIFGFVAPVNALNFCLRAQLALRDYEWEPSLLLCSKAQEERKGDTVLHRGLRVRMAVHWGNPSLRKDADTGKVSYVGSSMTVATSMPSQTQGGTIVLCQDMYNRLMSPTSTLDVDPFFINPMGSHTIDGKSIPLFKMVPALLQDLLHETQLETLGADEEKEPWLADFEDIKMGPLIGTGSFGDVFSATYLNKKVAAKKFIRQKLTGQLGLEMRTECAILRGLKHPNIIKFEAMCLQPPNLCLLTELMDRGSLSNVLEDSSNELPWSLKLAFARDIAEGLAYLHKNEIIHRDVKSSNLLVATNWTVKIGDFGFSRIKAANQTMTQCGTVAWTAPEIFDGSHYTEKADIYSYGVVLWELIFRKKPWAGKHSMKIIQTVETGGRLPLGNMPADVPPKIVPLMLSCWEHVPTKRPSFTQILMQLHE